MATTNTLGLPLALTPPLLTALRIAPLLSTTASLTHAYMEWLTTSSFLGPAPTTSRLSRSMLKPHEPTLTPRNVEHVERAKAQVIPAWFVNFFNTGVWSVVAFNNITLLSAIVNVFFYPTGLGEQRKLYVVGLAAGVAHYVFVPLVAPSVGRLFAACAAQEKGEEVGGEMTAVENVGEWVSFHRVRMGTVDVVAWVCFAVGAVGALSA